MNYSESGKLNKLEVEDALKELGAKGHSELINMCGALDSAFPSEVRYAPSIITRSEAQLLGISIPRFAFRFYLPNGGGFVNCRRLLTLIKHAEKNVMLNSGVKELSTKKEDQRIESAQSTSVRDILDAPGQSCVADCLLKPPGRFDPRKYTILTTDLEVKYGERLPKDPVGYWGTPYVKHIDLAGGVCAESSCFIATAILQNRAKGVYGLAEITAFANKDDSSALSISGLYLDDMARYFEHVSLRAIQQMPFLYAEASHERLGQEAFTNALRAYLLSGMPVVLPVDMARMAGCTRQPDGQFQRVDAKSVYGTNGFNVDANQFDFAPSHSHAIVLVGCSRDASIDNFTLVFHDPAYWPFMHASRRLFDKVGRYRSPTDSEREDQLMMPVTPNPVKLPLLSWRRGDADFFNRGLYWLSTSLHDMETTEYPRVVPLDAGNFLLSQIGRMERCDLGLYLRPELLLDFRTALKNANDSLTQNFQWGPEHWVWLEVFKDSIWIWDAEREIPSRRDSHAPLQYQVKNYLRAILCLNVCEKVDCRLIS